jgi:hypothetical protein
MNQQNNKKGQSWFIDIQAKNARHPNRNGTPSAKPIVADDWITQHLDMGHRSNVSRAVSAFRSPTQTPGRRLRRTLRACTD